MDLRGYQIETLKNIKDAVRSGVKRMVVQMPTGAGKTRLAAEIVNGAYSKQKRVIFEVPSIILVDQTAEMFFDEGIRDIGVIQADHAMTDWSKPIQIASVQTLMRREIPRADVVIRDECHKLFKFDMRWMVDDAWRNVPFIGLSATPWTRGLGRLYEKLIVGTTTRKLIDNGWLSSFRVFAPSHPDLSGVRTVAGDYHEGELAQAMNKSPLTADIVNTWFEKAFDRPTVCFAVDRAHARSLQEAFEQRGVATGYVDCESTPGERAELQRAFQAGRIKVVCNVDIVGIGVDWPSISCISYCRPTKSEMRFVQNIGRGLRMCEGKTDLLVLDHSDTSLRLGFVTDIHHETLNKDKEAASKKAQPRLPKECKKCGYLKNYGVIVCPNCGHEQKFDRAKIEPKDGELEEFKGKRSRKVIYTMEDKARFLAELKGYAIEKGYKQGWVWHKYREKFDVGIDNSIESVPAITPGMATRLWVKSRNIYWAKSRDNPNRAEQQP